jgi:hypothetical protein
MNPWDLFVVPRVVGALLLLGYLATASAAPAWWTTRGVVNAATPADDYSHLNLGQLKNMAANARDELNATLPNGAGTTVEALVSGWSNTTNADDYAICNVGQLKAVAKPFWERLLAEGWVIASQFPWTTTTADDDDFANANVGQLKTMFNFSSDIDNDGLPDKWEIQYAGSINVLNGNGISDYDGDGISDLAEYQMGWNPVSNDLNNAAKTETFTYDAANRLISVTGRSTLTYTPDANANLTQAN